jgi:hypothetical protein
MVGPLQNTDRFRRADAGTLTANPHVVNAA